MTFISVADTARYRRQFMRMVRTSDAATTLTLEREVRGSGTGIDPGTTPVTLAATVPVFAEKVHAVRRSDREVTLAGHVEAGQWNIMFPVPADVTWATGIAAGDREYRIDDLLTLADGTLLKVLTEGVDAVGHQELIAGPRN